MKLISALILVWAGFFTRPALAQSTFQNLDFQSANVPLATGEPSDQVSTSSAIPGWTAYLSAPGPNSEAFSSIYQNVFLYGNSYFSLVGPGPTYGTDPVSPIPGATYGILLSGGVLSAITISIFQTGTIPTNAYYMDYAISGNPGWITSFGGDVTALFRAG